MNIEVTRRNGLRQVAHDVRRQPAPFLLFTAYKTFAVLLFLQGFFFGGTFEVAGVALPLLAVFLLACAGVALGAWAASPARRAPRWALVASPACVLAGVFVMRFAFYMVHMTAGLGV